MRSYSFVSKLLASAVLAVSLILTGCATNVTTTSARTGTITDENTSSETRNLLHRDRSHVTRTGEVYLMRGLLNVFSRGMDTLAGRMRARGFDAISFNHADWMPYAQDMIARKKAKTLSLPIIIMGHSLGGNEAPRMANYLAANGIKTSLIVTFDPTEPQVVGKNIGTVINYYLPNGRNTFKKTSEFTGSLKNVDSSDIPGIKHVNIEKNTKLQNKSIARAMKITRKIKKRKIAKNRKPHSRSSRDG